jgi:rod shape-determining protein MreC
MRSLLRYLINNYAFLLFLFLEVVSLIFVFNFNKYQKVQYLNSSNRITASVYNYFDSVVKYFELAKDNEMLARENARLKSQPATFGSPANSADSDTSDFVMHDSNYRYISARVINNSVNKTLNYITLNKGSNEGVKPDMGIISPDGIVGVVISVSNSYALGFSLLNSRWGPSGKLKKSGFFGPIEWRGGDYREANLMEIPFHVELAVGDTIVTSGHSAVFPEGLMIGVVKSFSQPEGESFYKIKVQLATDFKSIHFVDIIENLDKEELVGLEKIIEDGAANN